MAHSSMFRLLELLECVATIFQGGVKTEADEAQFSPNDIPLRGVQVKIQVSMNFHVALHGMALKKEEGSKGFEGWEGLSGLAHFSLICWIRIGLQCLAALWRRRRVSEEVQEGGWDAPRSKLQLCTVSVPTFLISRLKEKPLAYPNGVLSTSLKPQGARAISSTQQHANITPRNHTLRAEAHLLYGSIAPALPP